MSTSIPIVGRLSCHKCPLFAASSATHTVWPGSQAPISLLKLLHPTESGRESWEDWKSETQLAPRRNSSSLDNNSAAHHSHHRQLEEEECPCTLQLMADFTLCAYAADPTEQLPRWNLSRFGFSLTHLLACVLPSLVLPCPQNRLKVASESSRTQSDQNSTLIDFSIHVCTWSLMPS